MKEKKKFSHSYGRRRKLNAVEEFIEEFIEGVKQNAVFIKDCLNFEVFNNQIADHSENWNSL